MSHIGYTRVSTTDQNSARQLAGVALDKLFEDKTSGKNTERPGLKACLEYLREGDTLHVHSLDRLARNLFDLQRLVQDLTSKGVSISFEKENLTFKSGGSSAMETLLLSLLGAVAQFERSLILERQREGIAIAKKKGVYTGRKPVERARLQAVHDKVKLGVPVAKACDIEGVSVKTYYNRRTELIGI